MSTEEQRKERRERYARKKELKARLEKYAEFAAYVVMRKREDRAREALCMILSAHIKQKINQ